MLFYYFFDFFIIELLWIVVGQLHYFGKNDVTKIGAPWLFQGNLQIRMRPKMLVSVPSCNISSQFDLCRNVAFAFSNLGVYPLSIRIISQN